MKKILATMLLAFALINAQANVDVNLEGTHRVKFEPLQASGALQGCSIVYLTAVKDVRTQNGDLVVVNGSITVHAADKKMVFGFKVGVKNLIKGTPFERPNFAYIQTKNASTAKVETSKFEGESGYSFYVYSALDKQMLKFLEDFLENKNIQIGYNLKEGGLDMLAPLDLFVVDSSMTANAEFKRKTSPDVLLAFSDCVGKLLEDIASDAK
jgi:hypothetical protein